MSTPYALTILSWGGTTGSYPTYLDLPTTVGYKRFGEEKQHLKQDLFPVDATLTARLSVCYSLASTGAPGWDDDDLHFRVFGLGYPFDIMGPLDTHPTNPFSTDFSFAVRTWEGTAFWWAFGGDYTILEFQYDMPSQSHYVGGLRLASMLAEVYVT